jgi:hypothetical protein
MRISNSNSTKEGNKMRIKFEDLKIGDTITATSWDDGPRTGIIDDLDEEGKNGRSTIGFGEHWCYIDQVIGHRRVAPAAPAPQHTPA